MSDDDVRQLFEPISIPSIGPAKELRPKGESPIELVVNNTGKYCAHRKVMVEDNARRVECGTCGASLDPFNALMMLCREHEKIDRDWTNARTETKAAETRLAMLKRLEENARSRVKKFGINSRRSYLDHLVWWLVRVNPQRTVDAADVERRLEHATPDALVRATLGALEAGQPLAALDLISRAHDALVAVAGALDEPAVAKDLKVVDKRKAGR